jgi:uncharacterized protein
MMGPGAFLLARLLKLPPPRFGVTVQRDIPVKMPDGARLFTDHYRPKVAGDWPAILIRTPYGRGKEMALGNGLFMAELPARRFAERGYHVVVQGARGCFGSEGEFLPHVNEARDGLATAEWIAAQPWFHGALGTWGPSYLGYMQWALAPGAPPYLKAMMVMLASAENYSVTHPDGAFGLETRLRWSQGMQLQARLHGRPRREQLRQFFAKDAERALQTAFAHLPLAEADRVAAGEPIPFYADLLTHTRPDDPFWAERDHSGAVGAVTAPVHLLGGWYDYYLRGLLRDYAALEAAGRAPHLTIGPWNHAHTGGMFAGLRAGIDWFDAHLKGDRSRLRRSRVLLYVMGAGEWRGMECFPPAASPTRYYLGTGGSLGTTPPAAGSPPDGYRYDPANPTPALGGALLAVRGAGAVDNRPLEARPDVVCYTTPPLERNLEIAGPVRMELYARSSLPRTDFHGRLCDVAPDGRSTNVCDGLFRVEPGRGEAQPDGSLRIEIDLWATAQRFMRGHRLRLQVSSGAHPRWSRNLGTGEPLATGVRMAAAEQIIFHDEAHPSAVVLPVTKG